MSAWIGPVGGLVEVLQYKGSLSVASERPSKSVTTLGGRVKVQRGPRARRVWSASVDGVGPEEAAGLLALDAAGTPPWVWVDPYAQVTNMFSPEQSLLAPGSFSGDGFAVGGAVTVDGAMSPRSVVNGYGGGTVDFGFRDGVVDRPVVVPGVPVTASVYVRGSGVVGLSFRDWSGSIISESTAPYSNATLARVSRVNRTPPPGSASVRFWATGVSQAAMPALTWTPNVGPWSVGRGCNRAVVEGLSEAIEQASPTNPDGRWASMSFTVREVG